MAGRIQAVFFDLFGTLVDIYTDEDDPQVYRTLARFLNYFQIYFTPEEIARAYREIADARLADTHNPYGEIDVFFTFEAILTEGRGKIPDRHMTIWLARLFRSLSCKHLRLFPNAPAVLEKIKDRYQLGIISDAQWVFSEPEIRMLELDKYFNTIVLSSKYLVRKPAPQIFTHALRAVNLEPDEAVYVGNYPPEDVPGPRAIGMPVILVDRWGGMEAPGVPVIGSLLDLPNVLEEMG